MMLAMASTTSRAIAKRIELTSSTKCLTARRLDFDCIPEVVTLIQTPTGQQKRVETPAVIDRRPTLFLFAPVSSDRLHNMGDCCAIGCRAADRWTLFDE
jgi:hypothetical protein